MQPWKAEGKYFKVCRVSVGAAARLLAHAQSSSHEVMGLLLGHTEGDCFWLREGFALPVESTETRVNAGEECLDYMIRKTELYEGLGRKDNCVGWYHSHPGFGCWLSGIDVATQENYQKINDPWVALVVDPLKTAQDGVLALGAFRTHPS